MSAETFDGMWDVRKAIEEGRCVIAYADPKLIVMALNLWTKGNANLVVPIIESDPSIPEDAFVVNVDYAACRGRTRIILAHPSFDRTPEGGVYPDLLALVHVRMVKLEETMWPLQAKRDAALVTAQRQGESA